MFHRRDNLGGGDPEHTAYRTERDRFDQELRENVATVRADRQTGADFASPFRYAHKHDVHDSDAADDERHAGNRAEQSRHHIRRRGRGVRDLLLIPHGEIVVATGANVMPLPQKRDDLLLRRGEIRGAGNLHVNFRSVVPPATRFIVLVNGITTTSS